MAVAADGSWFVDTSGSRAARPTRTSSAQDAPSSMRPSHGRFMTPPPIRPCSPPLPLRRESAGVLALVMAGAVIVLYLWPQSGGPRDKPSGRRRRDLLDGGPSRGPGDLSAGEHDQRAIGANEHRERVRQTPVIPGQVADGAGSLGLKAPRFRSVYVGLSRQIHLRERGGG